jgi:phenylpropionate dioxygenase-like ring-hydroxylating dioxygenase large terminal subunit
MSEASSSYSAAESLMLRGFWYSPLCSSQLGRGRPRGRGALKTARLLGTPLVLGRDREGRAFAMRDSCPHRGMPLSLGHFDGVELQCHYHGWRFDAQTGQCRLIPSLTADSKLVVERIRAGHFICEEHDGYVWVYVPYPGTRGEAEEPCPRLPLFGERYRMAHLSADLPLSIDHGIIGLMDPAHGPFVHQAWWWRSGSSIHEKQKHFEPIPLGFRMSAHAPSANSAAYKLLGVYGEPVVTTIDFRLPNIRLEQIRCGNKWFSSRAMVTPVTATTCRIDFCAAWNVFRYVPFMPSIFRFFGRMFIGQDQVTMTEQSLGLKDNPPLMLIDDADRPAKWYFALKQAYLRSRESGTPFEHPMAGPVTLRWRS